MRRFRTPARTLLAVAIAATVVAAPATANALEPGCRIPGIDGKTFSGTTRIAGLACGEADSSDGDVILIDGQDFNGFDYEYSPDGYLLDVRGLPNGGHVLTLGAYGSDVDQYVTEDYSIEVDNTTFPATFRNLDTGETLEDGDRVSGQATIEVDQSLALASQSIELVDLQIPSTGFSVTDRTAPFAFEVNADGLHDGVYDFKARVNLSDGRWVTTNRSFTVTKTRTEIFLDSSSDVVSPGQTVTISGQLYDSTGDSGISNRVLDLRSGTSASGPRIGSVTTAADGRFSYRFTPSAGGSVLLTYAGEPGVAGSVSEVFQWRVQSGVSLRTSDTHVTVGEGFVMTMRTQPAEAGIRVTLQSYYRGAWRSRGVATTRPDGTASMGFHFTRRGYAKFRALILDSPGLLDSESQVVTVTATP